MANTVYRSWKQALMTGTSLDLESVDIRCALVDTDDYTANTTSTGDEFLADIPSAAIEDTTANLTNVSVSDHTLDADDPTLPDSSGDTCEALVVYVHTGDDNTARLLAYIDTAQGLPIARDGNDDAVQWNSSGIVRL